MDEFKQLHENIIHMLEDLDEQLTEIIEEGSKPKDLGKQNLGNSSFLDSLRNKTLSEMDKIKRAISQVGSSRYSICIDCGQPIKKDQLNKMSFSKLCDQCAKQKNENSKS